MIASRATNGPCIMRTYLAAAIILAFLAAVRPARAQDFEPGLQVALSATTFSGDANTEFDFRTSFGAGVTLGIVFPGGFSIQPELRYVIKGATSDSAIVSNNPTPLRVKSTIAYLEIPVLLVYSFNSGGRLRPRVFAGPYLAQKLDATIEWSLRSGGLRQRESDESVSTTDFGFTVGAGVTTDIIGERVLFGARASFGRSDIRNRPDAPLHNMGLEIFTGIVFE